MHLGFSDNPAESAGYPGLEGGGWCKKSKLHNSRMPILVASLWPATCATSDAFKEPATARHMRLLGGLDVFCFGSENS